MSQPTANSLNALSKRNAMVAEARKLGIIKPHTLKNAELEAAIEVKRAELAEEKAKQDSDPTQDGDIHDCKHGRMQHWNGSEWVCPPECTETEDTIADKIDERDATREAWLQSAIAELRGPLKQVGAVVPESVAVSVGFAAKNVRKTLGVCFPTAASNGGVSHMFINPMLDDAIKVLDVLTHELIHASDDCKSKHSGHFAKCARAIGLEGKLTATHAGDELRNMLSEIAAKLGPYPHTKLNLGDTIKKQTTRLLKAMCSDDCCPLADDNGNVYTIRVTKKWVEIGMPKCPCGATMKLDIE